jgi:hypothetical protein
VSLKQNAKDGAAAFGGALAIGVGIIVLTVIIGLVGIFGFGWLSNSTANFRGEVSKRNMVEANGAYRIAAYDHFFDLCQQVQATEASISNTEDVLKTTTDAQLKTQYTANLLALRNNRADLITQYNADSDKSYTEGQFKSSNLPYELNVNKENTVCHA